MIDWAELSKELQSMLHLKTNIIGYRRLDKVEELEKIGHIFRVRRLFTFCQVPFLARVVGLTVGATKDDKMLDRCMRICGLKEVTEEDMRDEANMLSTTWFSSPGEALKQLRDYPHIPVGEAIVVGPLVRANFEPEVILIYGNPAQVMMLLCGLQKEKYEHFQFSFIGQGACVDSLAHCYVNGKPAVSIPCYSERAFGQVADDEMAIALPPGEIERAISGLKKLAKSATGFAYPIQFVGGWADVAPPLTAVYPDFTAMLKK